MRHILGSSIVVVLLSSVAACGSDEEGQAPELSQLSFNPMRLGVGAQTTVSGTMTFADADGDLSQLGVEVVMPNASRQAIPLVDLAGVEAMTEGELLWAFVIAPPLVGDYAFDLWVTDAEDHASNRLSGTLVAE